MTTEQARQNMIKQQLHAWDVLDEKILALFRLIPRENFVPNAYQELAFADINIPLGNGVNSLPPKEEARLLQTLEVKSTDKVLVLGTGSGFLTALLAKLAHWVYSIDDYPPFIEAASQKLANLHIQNVFLAVAPAMNGWAQEAPYDVIVINGSLPAVPLAIQQMLATHGRMFAIIGNPPVMEAVQITRMANDLWQTKLLYETQLTRLPGMDEPKSFTF